MVVEREELEGWVVDIACLRKWPQGEMAERARWHTRACSLEGHCAESGFGLVDNRGRVQLLEPAATLRVLDAVRGSDRERGIRVRAVREGENGRSLETIALEELPPPDGAEPTTPE